MEVVRKKVLRLQSNPENPLALPQKDLLSMSLRALLIVIQVLGKYRHVADGFSELAGEHQLVSAASRVLADWPNNFFALLQALGERKFQEAHVGVRKQFEDIYHALFKNKTIQPPEQMDFLRKAFIDFALDHWGRGAVDSRLLRGLRGDTTGRFMSQAAFARKIGVQPRTATKILKDFDVSSERVTCGDTTRLLVDVTNVSIASNKSGGVLRCRDAARHLGISPEVLRILKHVGTYQVLHLSPTRPGFHIRDVELFTQKLLAMAPPSEVNLPSDQTGIALGAVLRNTHVSAAWKARALEAILSKDIVALGNTNGTLRGLILEACTYERCFENARNNLNEQRNPR